ncbi:MAG: hypothetical protein GWO20_03540 [Candidatus Korarchaeota archaeon]|nr:hypothetical protein [Candidatus Korarchaeota archaeon]NIU81947.1 hypothetical protein [Candidatus Thorarchaeota archaeon]NIW12404.1 hypothetical protein [Candidatus Thorarchaeota archaeon]NIW51197.1 hypothetical protein [Candidatus Korarchaeota archaeon]
MSCFFNRHLHPTALLTITQEFIKELIGCSLNGDHPKATNKKVLVYTHGKGHICASDGNVSIEVTVYSAFEAPSIQKSMVLTVSCSHKYEFTPCRVILLISSN